jgi:hypothetical protein
MYVIFEYQFVLNAPSIKGVATQRARSKNNVEETVLWRYLQRKRMRQVSAKAFCVMYRVYPHSIHVENPLLMQSWNRL